MLNLSTANLEKAFNFTGHLNCILTIGNTWRSDDGVGPYIASRLKSNRKVIVIDAGYTPENVIEQIIELKPKYILIIDAADFGGKPGEVKIINKEHIPETSLSTHSISLKIIAAILREETNAAINFLGIQPKTVVMGEGLSAEVRKAADKIIKKLKGALLHNSTSA